MMELNIVTIMFRSCPDRSLDNPVCKTPSLFTASLATVDRDLFFASVLLRALSIINSHKSSTCN